MAKALAHVPVPQFDIPGPVKVFIPGTREAGQAGSDIVHGVTGAGHAVVSGTEAIGKLSEKLVEPQTWVRVGEVLVGTVLLIVGFDHLFGTDLTGKAAKVIPYAL